MAFSPSVRSTRRREAARLAVGVVAELGIKAYGVGAATSVALSDAETLGAKATAAVEAVPNLEERYRSAEYVVDHRQEIQDALDYVSQNVPPQDELEAAAAQSSETLRGIATTFDEVSRAREALADIDFFTLPPRGVVSGAQEAFGHARRAVAARPDADSLDALADRAEQAAPLVEQVRVLSGGAYGGLLNAADNFAGDEIATTLSVMAAALGLALVLGSAVGFWARRGRPGLLARALHERGARRYRRWYVANLEHALGEPLHAAARERFRRDVLADPGQALDADVLEHLRSWFAREFAARRDAPPPAATEEPQR